MPIDVQFFGEFKTNRDGSVATFPTHPTENLCAYLAFHAGKSINRDELAAIIWPNVEPEKAQNRLRTALVHLRQSLDPAQPIQADRQAACFSDDDFESDVRRAEKLHRSSRLSQSQDDERRSLEGLLAIIGADFLAGWSEEWTETPRQLWHGIRLQAALRLGHIYLDLNLIEHALVETERIFSTDPFHEEGWALHFRVMVEMNQAREASEQFRQARRRLREQMDFDFSPELLDFARRVAGGQVQPKGAAAQLSPLEKDVIGRAIEGQISRDPASLIPILTGEAFRAEAMQHPLDSWQLIRRVIDTTEGTDPERIKLMLLGMSLADMVDDIESGLDLGEWIIENTEKNDPLYHRAMSALGFYFFEIRDYVNARKYLTENLELAKKRNSDLELGYAACQLASLNWHEGDLDLAEQMYLDSEKVFDTENSVRGRFNGSMVLGNIGFIHTIRQDWDKAEHYFERSYSTALANKFDYIRGATMGPLAASRIAQGKKEGGRQMASVGLAQTFRSRYRRMNQVSADYAAISLILLGHKAEGLAVLNQFAHFRKADRHEWSVAEQRLADWAVQMAGGAKPDPAWLQLTKPAAVIAKSCDLLDEI